MPSHNTLRSRLRAGETLLGTMVTLNSPAVVEILGAVGFDWLFLDAEHAPYAAADLQLLMQAAGPSLPCLVRLAAGDEVSIKKALDAGAAGVIVPLVNRAEEAAQVVRHAKYSPQGTRGVGIGRAHGYGLNFQAYVETANEETAVIVQAEHIRAVENIEAIVAVPGIDGILIGPYDLSASLGLIGQVGHPTVVDAIRRVTEACRNAGIALGIFGVTADAVKPYLDEGYTLIVAGVDTVFLGQGAGTLLADLKG